MVIHNFIEIIKKKNLLRVSQAGGGRGWVRYLGEQPKYGYLKKNSLPLCTFEVGENKVPPEFGFESSFICKIGHLCLELELQGGSSQKSENVQYNLKFYI